MALEIERKFLVDKTLWEQIKVGEGVRIIQGYLLSSPEKTIRVRIKGDKGFLTIKGKTEGISRLEYEYEIPVSEAEDLLFRFCPKRIDKIRFEIDFKGFTWEVDEFKEPNTGLILAEIELQSEEGVFALPGWITKEVSGEQEYYNSNML